MRILVLTSELTEKHGYGRYSLGLIHALKDFGVEVCIAKDLPNPLSYKKNYFLAFWYALRLRKEAVNCDVIHSLVEPYSYIAYVLAKLTRKPYFVTAHGTFGVLPYSFPAYLRYFHKKSFGKATKIICVSNYTKRRLQGFGLKNLAVAPNGIDVHRFTVRSPRQKKSVILSVGALKHRKGYHVSIPAFAKVNAELKNLQYYIVGEQSDAAYYTQLKQLATDLSLNGKVVFIESISDDDLLRLYEESLLFVLTPVSEGSHFEGFGLVYLEANALGLPVVGSLNSGAEEAIRNGETGLLVPQNVPQETANAMLKILKDEMLYNSLAQTGRAWAQKHDWNLIVRKYLEMYGAQ